jgi:flagellar motor switch protein FliM
VSEPIAASELNPFQQTRLLTAERSQLFTRTCETLAQRIEQELSRWFSDATAESEAVEMVMIPDLAQPDTDLAIIKSQYHVTHGVIATELRLALSLVTILCGGLGQPEPEELRPLSRLEMGVYDLLLKPIMRQATRVFMVGESELWTHVSTATALPDSKPEPGVAFPFRIAIGPVEGRLVIGFTAAQLQAYSEDLDRKIAGRHANKQGEPSPQIVKAVRPIPVDLVVGFDPMQVPAGQLASLQVGDVLRTRQLVSKSLVARVGGERVFLVRAAQQGQRLVAEVIGRVGEKGVAGG